jgi:hypothetical protein
LEPVSVIQPYNTVLGLASLLASADLSVLVGQDQGQDMGVGVGLGAISLHDRRHFPTPPPAAVTAGIRSPRKAPALSAGSTFTAENTAAASVICNITSTMRFHAGNSRWLTHATHIHTSLLFF